MKKTIQTLSALALGLTMAEFPAGAGTVEVTGDITVNTTWSATNTYILRKVVFVQTNAVLTIEPGTVIKGGVSNLVSSVSQGIPNLVSALWVTRGARLEACGTPSKPIIFTAETDDVNNPTDLPLYSSGIWGGVVLMGNAVLNSAQLGVGQSNSPIYDIYEGTSILTNNAFTAFGGTNDNDNSGTLKYVSIRYTGNTFATDRELNGLTMGGVGKGTTIEHVEVIGSSDDGFEWWGGCVDSKYLVAAFCEDDSFDTDQGYRGRNQFWFAIQKPTVADRLMEVDGDLNQTGYPGGNAAPTSTWEIQNFTGIGRGAGLGLGLNFRDEARPRMNNSVMADLATATTIDSDGLNEHLTGVAWVSNTVAQATTLHSANAGTLAGISALAGYALNANVGLTSISRTNNFGLNPSPTNGAVAATGASGIPNDGFYTQVGYRGAFQPGQTETWMHGWTALYRLGVLNVSASSPQLAFLTPETPEFTIIDEINGRLCMAVEDQQESYVTPKLYLQCTDSLTSPNWQTIQVVRNGCDVKSVLAKVGDPARFYRIIRAH